MGPIRKNSKSSSASRPSDPETIKRQLYPKTLAELFLPAPNQLILARVDKTEPFFPARYENLSLENGKWIYHVRWLTGASSFLTRHDVDYFADIRASQSNHIMLRKPKDADTNDKKKYKEYMKEYTESWAQIGLHPFRFSLEDAATDVSDEKPIVWQLIHHWLNSLRFFTDSETIFSTFFFELAQLSNLPNYLQTIDTRITFYDILRSTQRPVHLTGYSDEELNRVRADILQICLNATTYHERFPMEGVSEEVLDHVSKIQDAFRESWQQVAVKLNPELDNGWMFEPNVQPLLLTRSLVDIPSRIPSVRPSMSPGRDVPSLSPTRTNFSRQVSVLSSVAPSDLSFEKNYTFEPQDYETD